MLYMMHQEDRTEPSAAEAAILAREPPCDEAMALVIEAWRLLNGDRPRILVQLKDCQRMVTESIPFLAIDAWARRRGLDDEHTLLVADVIARLDDERSERVWNDLKG